MPSVLNAAPRARSPRHAYRLAAALSLAALALGACDRDAPTTAPPPDAPRADVAAEEADTSRGLILPIEVTGEGGEYFVTGTVLARFRPGADATQVARAHGAAVQRRMLLARTFVLSVPAGREAVIARALARNPNIEFAETDRLMVVTPCESGSCTLPTDSFLGYKWDLHNDGTIRNSAGTLLATSGAADADIDWLEAFNVLGSGFAGAAVIGIVDTGIRGTHQDLAGKVIGAQNFATGYAATLIEDRDGHGTHVAGIAAGRGNNGLGVSGVGFGANIKLLSAKACDLYLFPGNVVSTSCPNSSTSNAIVWATDNGANVINLSLGGNPAATVGSAAQQAALQYARAHDVLPFCSTGNDNYPGVSFPARFPECVAVGATDWGDDRASYSNYGAAVALSAPGGDGESLPNGYSLVLSADRGADNSYSWKAGTSMAAPQAAGLAALLYATGYTTASDVLARLTLTADDLGDVGRDPQFGFGRINAFRAVASFSTTVTVSPAAGQYSDQVTLTATLATSAPAATTLAATGTMEFFLDGTSLGTTAVTAAGPVTKALTLSNAAASYNLTAQFTSTNASYASSALSAAAALTVSAEAATLTYAPTNAAALKVASAGGASPAFALQVSVAETQPDLPSAAALAGDINLAPVRMTLAPVGPGSAVTGACTAPAAAAGYTSRTYSCTFAAGVPVNTYVVQASVDALPAGRYYVGSTEDVFTVYDPSLGFISGGGSFAWPGTGERTTFGVTLKYKKGGTGPSGNLVVVRHLSDGTAYRLKSNALAALAMSPASSSYGYATFGGKGTYLEPGWAEPKGNVAFTAYVQDGNEPGTGADRFWLQVTGGMGMPSPAASNAQPLTGGNIVVPHGGR